MRRLILLMTAMGVAVLVIGGVAYALSVQCDGAGDQNPNPGICEGTEDADTITGTNNLDRIDALVNPARVGEAEAGRRPGAILFR